MRETTDDDSLSASFTYVIRKAISKAFSFSEYHVGIQTKQRFNSIGDFPGLEMRIGPHGESLLRRVRDDTHY